MARLFNLRAPKSLRIEQKSPQEIEKLVTEQAARYLEALPNDLRPSGLSGVALESLVKGTANDPGVWAQWTRACCDRRRDIDDFVDPLRDEFELAAAQLRPRSVEHLESQHVTQVLSNPKMHGK